MFRQHSDLTEHYRLFPTFCRTLMEDSPYVSVSAESHSKAAAFYPCNFARNRLPPRSTHGLKHKAWKTTNDPTVARSDFRPDLKTLSLTAEVSSSNSNSASATTATAPSLRPQTAGAPAAPAAPAVVGPAAFQWRSCYNASFDAYAQAKINNVRLLPACVRF